mmetsp:Transcript_5872/g.19176  ORF Transcript_5872/g.19176 Transcript_5872/m.19176 type:complete len:231 (-) Transcript_5872:508-1200(-)
MTARSARSSGTPGASPSRHTPTCADTPANSPTCTHGAVTCAPAISSCCIAARLSVVFVRSSLASLPARASSRSAAQSSGDRRARGSRRSPMPAPTASRICCGKSSGVAKVGGSDCTVHRAPSPSTGRRSGPSVPGAVVCSCAAVMSEMPSSSRICATHASDSSATYGRTRPAVDVTPCSSRAVSTSSGASARQSYRRSCTTMMGLRVAGEPSSPMPSATRSSTMHHVESK